MSQYGHTLQVHHLVYRRNGGSDHHSNLVTLCHKCHAKRHTGDVRPRADTKGWTPERLRAIRVEYFGFSQQEMADMLRTPQRTYGDWETKGLPGYVGVTVELLMTPGAMEMIEKGVKA